MFIQESLSYICIKTTLSALFFTTWNRHFDNDNMVNNLWDKGEFLV